MFCKQCGNQIEDTATACAKKGTFTLNQNTDARKMRSVEKGIL
jgi:hypothetical protein